MREATRRSRALLRFSSICALWAGVSFVGDGVIAALVAAAAVDGVCASGVVGGGVLR